jgi:hypothetical protein
MRINNVEYSDERNTMMQPIGWYCDCNGYNDLLTPFSRYTCNSIRPESLELDVEIAIRKRGALEFRANFMPMNDDLKELHAKFFAEEKAAYKTLDFDARRIHRTELEQICFEAKARISAMDWIEREESESLNPTQREWLRNSRKNPNPNLTDAITVIKDRKKRVSKADKLLADMQSLGIANAEELILNVERKATKSKMDGMTFNAGKKSNITLSELCRTEQHDSCPARFRVGDTSYDCKCKCHAEPEVVVQLSDFNF